ncbi:hypothetical protein CK203_066839 [Vitis vinifera]|uniref:Uncharacterized protein n=1 Tax=Vitis vinifera TaxID=29760 RepID=A0A438EVK2_VITVI|nr:hypothetical protein CK203_066839 [Vitis vinifera]
MLSLGNCLDGHSLYCLLITTVTAVILQAPGASSIVAPSSNCYALDNSSHIFDFGYVDFGRFDKFNYFVAGSGHINFVQEFYNGDLLNCETTHDKMGRTAQVNIICGSCSNGQCAGELGCICNVTYESTCRSSTQYLSSFLFSIRFSFPTIV